MKALVIGGAGFIGSHVVDRLIDSNVETCVFVSGFRSQKHPSIINKNANIIKGDIRNYESLIAATKDIDVVFQLGVFSVTMLINTLTWRLMSILKECGTLKMHAYLTKSSE